MLVMLIAFRLLLLIITIGIILILFIFGLFIVFNIIIALWIELLLESQNYYLVILLIL